MSIPGLECSILLTTYDNRNNQEVVSNEEERITLNNATLSWIAKPKGVEFKLDYDGMKREKQTINEIVSKEIPADVFVPEIPTNIDIPGGGGTEEVPTMEDYVEQIIESVEEFTLESDISMDGLHETQAESEGSFEHDFEQQADEVQEDIIEEQDDEEDQDQEEIVQESNEEDEKDKTKEEAPKEHQDEE